MNFQGLSKIESYQFYLDVAFNSAKNAAEEARVNAREEHIRNIFTKSKIIEKEKLQTIERSICGNLNGIVKKFPKVNELPVFYKELMQTVINIKELEKSLTSVGFVSAKVKDLTQLYLRKVRCSKTIEDMNVHRRGYYGRISSLLKEIKQDLEILEFARKEVKEFPAIKTNMPTVCICGFPNVGKSTLLKKITGSNVEIQSYAFTTKQLLMGYANLGYGKVQFIDSPGVLNREDKENMIEHQAYLAVKYLANCCVFVLDLTLSSGYDVSDQLKLLSDLKKRFEKEFIVYLSKSDLMDNNTILEFKKKKNYVVVTDVDSLIKEVEKHI
jgi:nucleolar GTP-binding protein